ncbi:MAG: hypothetical protein AAB360_02540 [Patescibacteria group bacterium]
MIKHLISTQQFSNAAEIENFFILAKELERLDQKDKLPQSLKNKAVACLFYEPSTRTRLSFETAALKLGGSVISSENAKEFSSAAKGETIEDTARVISNYADALVIRHYERGISKRAAKVSPALITGTGISGNSSKELNTHKKAPYIGAPGVSRECCAAPSARFQETPPNPQRE